MSYTNRIRKVLWFESRILGLRAPVIVYKLQASLELAGRNRVIDERAAVPIKILSTYLLTREPLYMS